VVPAADLVLAVNSQHMRDAKQISTHAYADMCARQDPQLTDRCPKGSCAWAHDQGTGNTALRSHSAENDAWQTVAMVFTK
jgi:hypothetical protein